jgi:hypothetical protein
MIMPIILLGHKQYVKNNYSLLGSTVLCEQCLILQHISIFVYHLPNAWT